MYVCFVRRVIIEHVDLPFLLYIHSLKMVCVFVVMISYKDNIIGRTELSIQLDICRSYDLLNDSYID